MLPCGCNYPLVFQTCDWSREPLTLSCGRSCIVVRTCRLEASTLLSSLSGFSLCHSQWTASTSPAPGCDRFVFLCLSSHHTLTDTSLTLSHSYMVPPHSAAQWLRMEMRREKEGAARHGWGNQYLKKLCSVSCNNKCIQNCYFFTLVLKVNRNTSVSKAVFRWNWH